MSAWKEYRLGELASVIPGYAFKGKDFGDNGCRVVKIGDIAPPIVDVANCLRIPTDKINGLDKFKLQKGDFVLAMTGATLGKVGKYRSEETGYINQRVAKFENINGISDKQFLYYLITSNNVTNEIINRGLGSAQPNISGKDIESINVVAPDLPTQTAIAEILASLDDKIELNNKINQELENLAQTLFKQWFIDFEFPNENGEPYKSSGGEMVESELGEIPKGWEVGSIYDISSVIYGAPFKSSLFNQERKGYPLIRIRDLKTFKPQNWTEEVLSKGTKIQPGDLVVGMDAEFRPHFWLGEEGWLNQRVCLFKPKSEFSRLFVREIIRPLLAFYENSSVGTTVIHLGKGDIDTFKSIIPSNHLSKLFTELSEPLINKIIENSRENESLRNLRDTLLPKLISGELEINEIKN